MLDGFGIPRCPWQEICAPPLRLHTPANSLSWLEKLLTGPSHVAVLPLLNPFVPFMV